MTAIRATNTERGVRCSSSAHRARRLRSLALDASAWPGARHRTWCRAEPALSSPAADGANARSEHAARHLATAPRLHGYARFAFHAALLIGMAVAALIRWPAPASHGALGTAALAAFIMLLLELVAGSVGEAARDIIGG